MWLLVAREPRSDAPEWPGRRLLAAVDAVLWPLLWVWVFRQAPEPVGLVGPFVTAMAVLFGLVRLHRALWVNHRYWFTTWRWGRVAAALLVVGAVLKVTMTGSGLMSCNARQIASFSEMRRGAPRSIGRDQCGAMPPHAARAARGSETSGPRSAGKWLTDQGLSSA